eukprot:1161379-Pelagomonas_calceolata.AAC.1
MCSPSSFKGVQLSECRFAGNVGAPSKARVSSATTLVLVGGGAGGGVGHAEQLRSHSVEVLCGRIISCSVSWAVGHGGHRGLRHTVCRARNAPTHACTGADGGWVATGGV